MPKITRKQYEFYLDNNAPPQGDERWIIGGVIRMAAMWQNKYGATIRKHDPIAFEVGYQEWLRKNS